MLLPLLASRAERRSWRDNILSPLYRLTDAKQNKGKEKQPPMGVEWRGRAAESGGDVERFGRQEI